MWHKISILTFMVLGSGPLLANPAPPYGKPRQFAGKIEGNWEYGVFRECRLPAACAERFKSCGYKLTLSAQKDWSRLLPEATQENYWIEFVGRKRTASHNEMADNLDPQMCIVEIQKVTAACVSSSPIYPDENGAFPACASIHGPRTR
jgi:hypothetical protein